MLEALWLSGRRLSNRGLATVLAKAPRLRILKLTQCFWLTSDVFTSIARLAELRCLWWSARLVPTRPFLNHGGLLEFAARFMMDTPDVFYMADFGTAFAGLQSLNIRGIYGRAPLEKVFAHTPRLRLLRFDHVVIDSFEDVQTWASELFSACPSLQRLDVRQLHYYYYSARDFTPRAWVRSALVLCVELERSAARVLPQLDFCE